MPNGQASTTITGNWDLNKGLVNARADSDLKSGELTIAHGVLYKRGSEELWMKSGRTAFDPTSLGTPGVGLFYAEFSNPLASNLVLARAGTSLWAATAGLTGTFASAVSGLSAVPTGLWGAYTNQRYYLQDGASPLQVFGYQTNQIDPTTGALTPGFFYHTAGMLSTNFKPVVTPVDPGVGTAVLTSASIEQSGDRSFDSPALWVDGDKNTAASVTLSGDAGNYAKIRAHAFTGTGSGTRSDWIIDVTYSATSANGGQGNVLVMYSLDGNFTQTVAESATAPQGKHTVTIPLFGVSQASSAIHVIVQLKKTITKGQVGCQLHDVRIRSTDGTSTSDNTLLTGVYYWITEAAPLYGIESAAGIANVSDSTGPVTNISGFRVSLPSSPQNSIATKYNIYRTVDGGAYPTGTLVGSVPIQTPAIPYYFDPGPLNLTGGTITYGFFQVAGLYYERDLYPPVGTILISYQNALVTVPVDTPNILRYSAAGFPESWPTLNSLSMGSDRDDTIMGLATLSNQLGVFMRGRCKRVDHLPTPSDPTFGAVGEDFAPDHGLESRNGIAYITPPSETSTHVAYVGKDGIRLTNLYQSVIITNNINWRATVDVSKLSDSILRAVPSESRLEFYFTPTLEFTTLQGWPEGIHACMFIHYQIQEKFDLSHIRITAQPANISAAYPVPYRGQDYMFLLSNGVNTLYSVAYVDEVGSTDAMNSVDSAGTIPRMVQTGKVYLDPDASKLVRFRIRRVTLDRSAGTDTILLGLRAGRIKVGAIPCSPRHP